MEKRSAPPADLISTNNAPTITDGQRTNEMVPSFVIQIQVAKSFLMLIRKPALSLSLFPHLTLSLALALYLPPTLSLLSSLFIQTQALGRASAVQTFRSRSANAPHLPDLSLPSSFFIHAWIINSVHSDSPLYKTTTTTTSTSDSWPAVCQHRNTLASTSSELFHTHI